MTVDPTPLVAGLILLVWLMRTLTGQ